MKDDITNKGYTYDNIFLVLSKHVTGYNIKRVR